MIFTFLLGLFLGVGYGFIRCQHILERTHLNIINATGGEVNRGQ
jgi:hypothetical protein